MQRFKLFVGSAGALLLTPLFASAQLVTDAGLTSTSPFRNIFENILTFTNDVLIPFVIGIGFLMFVWGMFKFFIVGGANDDAKESGKSLMIYATLGFLLIIVFYGVVNLLAGTTGLGNENLDDVPSVGIGVDRAAI
jgi:hypothetical protein